jgi:hypothetical protein
MADDKHGHLPSRSSCLHEPLLPCHCYHASHLHKPFLPHLFYSGLTFPSSWFVATRTMADDKHGHLPRRSHHTHHYYGHLPRRRFNNFLYFMSLVFCPSLCPPATHNDGVMLYAEHQQRQKKYIVAPVPTSHIKLFRPTSDHEPPPPLNILSFHFLSRTLRTAGRHSPYLRTRAKA